PSIYLRSASALSPPDKPAILSYSASFPLILPLRQFFLSQYEKHCASAQILSLIMLSLYNPPPPLSISFPPAQGSMKELAIPTPKDGEGTRCRTAAFSKTAAPAAINISFIFFLPHLCLHHFSVFAAQLHQLLMGSPL